ncbi:MAG TPA: hypothetical protein DCE81_12855 [Cytophagales bacterium]|nr:hypothetical protein [Cytophagales bacterium]
MRWLILFFGFSSLYCQAQYDTLRFINGESIVLKGDTLITFPNDFHRGDFRVVESAASYPGGLNALYQYFGESLRMPIQARVANANGSVNVAFTIDKHGLPKNIVAQGDTTLGRGAEAIRIVREMPRWIPATQRGLVKPMRLALPISFNVNITKGNRE